MISTYPVIDLIAWAILLVSLNESWRSWVSDPDADSVEERNLGATVIMGQLNSVITGSSIIIAGIAAFVALEKQEIGDPEKYHLLYATMWAVVALTVALYTIGTLPAQTPKRNFVQIKGVAIFCSTALFFSLAAGIRFMFAVSSILF